MSCVTGVEQGEYMLDWGWVLQSLGDTKRGLKLAEQALEIGQGQDRLLELHAFNNMAAVYRALGQLQRALELYEQALPLLREVGDRADEGATLNNMALVYQSMGQLQRALELYEQALPLLREVGDHAGEAATLNNIAVVYRETGQWQRALELYEQALSIRREVGDRAGEAGTLNNIAVVYRLTGQQERALELYEQALPLLRRVGDRAGEAVTLNNLAAVYLAMGQLQQALELYEQALSIRREVGDRVGEAATLTGMALVYQLTGQPQRALEFCEQALSITREVGDRVGEANTLNIFAEMHESGQPQRALELHEQVLLIRREVGDHAGEAHTLANMAVVLYKYLNRSQEAITKMEQAIAVLVETGLPQDAAGQTIDEFQRYLDVILRSLSPGQAIGGTGSSLAAQLQVIVANTVAVMTTMQEHHVEWRKIIAGALQQAQEQGGDWQFEVDLFTAIVALLDGQSPTLPSDHPYAATLTTIQEGIAGGLQNNKTNKEDELPFDTELKTRSIAALLGGPQEKVDHMQYLAELSSRTKDEGLKELIKSIKLAMFDGDLLQLGQSLSGVYRQAWEAIVVGVETGGVDPRLFEMLVQNTLAVLGPAADKKSEWREALTQIRSQAMEGDAQELVALLDAVIGLLDAGGNFLMGWVRI